MARVRGEGVERRLVCVDGRVLPGGAGAALREEPARFRTALRSAPRLLAALRLRLFSCGQLGMPEKLRRRAVSAAGGFVSSARCKPWAAGEARCAMPDTFATPPACLEYQYSSTSNLHTTAAAVQ